MSEFFKRSRMGFATLAVLALAGCGKLPAMPLSGADPAAQDAPVSARSYASGDTATTTETSQSDWRALNDASAEGGAHGE